MPAQNTQGFNLPSLGNPNSLELASSVMYYMRYLLWLTSFRVYTPLVNMCTGGSQGIYGDANGPESLDFDSG